jgi:regulation of enolase protein 1 (concanavalin A-like superfamily)
MFRFVAVCIATTLLAAPVPESKTWRKGWDKPVDPKGDCRFEIAGDKLIIVVPGKRVDAEEMNDPMLLRDVESDFVVQVRVGGPFKQSDEEFAYQYAGLIIVADKKTYALGWEMRGPIKENGFKADIYLKWILTDTATSFWGRPIPFDDKQLLLRIQRRGNKLLPAYTHDGRTWNEIRPLEPELPGKLKVGVFAYSLKVPEFKYEFDQFSLSLPGK